MVKSDANIRSGPGTAYPIIGAARVGQRLSVIGQARGWWQIAFAGRTGWIWGALVTPNAAAQQAPQVKDLPPLPPTPTPTPTAAPSLQPVAQADLVVLGPETQYPVRAQRICGDGYEFVDASSQYDLVLQRDVYGAVIRQFWGDRLFGKHPRGIRITLLDPDAPPACAIICRNCPGQPTIPRLLAPIRLTNDWRGDCHARSLPASYGDGAGATIWVGCAFDSDDARGVQTDPEECFVAIAAPGPHLTDLLVSATISTYHWLVVKDYQAMTPDFGQAPFTPHLGRAYRAEDQPAPATPRESGWRWAELFVVVVPAQ
jgi:hypothetical protein